MTTNVSIHNTPGHWKVKVFRRFPSTGLEIELTKLRPGDMGHHLSVWDDCELVIREVPLEPQS